MATSRTRRKGLTIENLPDGLKPFAILDINAIGAHAYRWRFNMKTGTVTEGPLGIRAFGIWHDKPWRCGIALSVLLGDDDKTRLVSF